MDPEVLAARRALLDELLAGPNFAMLTTLEPDGTPRSHVMWVSGTSDLLEINTQEDRQKYRDMLRDPRVTITIWELDRPARFVEVIGRVARVVRGDVARTHIDALAQRYLGRPYDAASINAPRVLFEVVPERLFAVDVTTTDVPKGIWSA